MHLECMELRITRVRTLLLCIKDGTKMLPYPKVNIDPDQLISVKAGDSKFKLYQSFTIHSLRRVSRMFITRSDLLKLLTQ